ncbi:MAG TPA: RNA polymerase-binding protein RbpA [Micromonosporaceae bacterium]|nr:RNA polymerase-binding protein RbpA [Micromonosporaceae bacterium]
MASGNAIRGTRVGSSPVRWVDTTAERMEVVPRRNVTYWCGNGHRSERAFAADVVAPAIWDCPRCGQPAGLDPMNPPAKPVTEPYKTHLAYVKERRSDADGAAILAEAMQRLRERRGE